MGFCKICTGIKKPGLIVKIVVKLKKDILCRKCKKHYRLSKVNNKTIIFISKRYLDGRPDRPSRTRRLRAPIPRHDSNKPKKNKRLGAAIPWGVDMDYIRNLSEPVLDLDVGNPVPVRRSRRVQKVEK